MALGDACEHWLGSRREKALGVIEGYIHLMSRRQRIGLVVVIALVVSATAAAAATREKLAAGGSNGTEWKLVAHWAGGYCLKMHHPSGEGGACGFTTPPTLNETVVWLVCDGDKESSVAAGPVTDEAERVRVVFDNGEELGGRLEQVLGLRFFVAMTDGVHGLDEVVAEDDEGTTVDQLDSPYPPPYRSDGSTDCD